MIRLRNGDIMKRTFNSVAGISILTIYSALYSAKAQGSFQNLNFESATGLGSPQEPYPNLVPAGSALPGWTAYLGTVQVTQVGYNAPANSTASITLIGPTWNSSDTSLFRIGIIDGDYSVDLQTGANPLGGEPGLISASIEQNGTVPGNAESLQFEALETTPLTVTFNGNVLSPIALSSAVSPDGLPYTLYGANISAWAGQTGELEFTADQVDENYVVLDDITFSPNSVPEPTTLTLVLMGGVALAARRWRTKRA